MKIKHLVLIPVLFTTIQLGAISCRLTSPVPTGISIVAPTTFESSTRTPAEGPSLFPTTTPYTQLEELATLGKGILPQIVRSNDGKKVFVSNGYSLRVLNAEDYREITSINLSEDGFAGIETISPDGRLVVVGHYLGFQVIEISTQKKLAGAWGGNGAAVGPVFTPDNNYIVYLSADRTPGGPYYGICLLNIINDDKQEECYPVLNPRRYHVLTPPVVSPDGKLVAAGYADSTNNILYIWDLMKRTIVYEIKGQPSRINSVDFNPDGSILASASDDGLIRLWDPATGKIRRSIPAFVDDVKHVEFSPDGRQLIVDVAEQPQIAYGLDTGKITKVPSPPLDPLAAQMLEGGYLMTGAGSKIRFSPDGKTVAVGHGSIQVWNVQSHNLVAALSVGQPMSLAGMTYSADSHHLAVITIEGDIYSWDIRSGQQEFFLSASTLLNAQIFYAAGGSGLGPGIGTGVFGEQGIAFSPDASQIALGNGPVIEIWDIKTVSKVMTLAQTRPVAFPTRISFSQNREFIYAVLNRNRDLAVWNARTGELIRQLNLPRVDPNAFSATDLQGALFARNNYDDQDYWIEIWNVETSQMTKLPTHVREAEPLRFSADGKFFMALLNHNQLYIWRTETGQLVFVSDLSSEIGDMAINPDGKLLATATFGKVTLWDFGQYANASFQAGFTPAVMPPTLTPWTSSDYAYPTATPQLAQVVTPIPVPSFQMGAIDEQNASKLQLLARLGKGRIGQIGWSKDSSTMLVVSSMGFYQLNSQTLKETDQFEPDSLYVTGGQVLPDGHSLVAGFTMDGKVQAWDATNKKMLVELKGSGQPAISPNGRWLVYEDTAKGLGMWNLKTGQPGTVLRSSYYLSWPVFSPNSQFVATIQSDRSIRVWNVETGVIVNGIGGPEADITDMSFSPDGSLIVGAAGGTAWVWSMAPSIPPLKINLFQGEINRNFTIFTNAVTSVAISANNSLIAIGTSEKKIWLYNREMGKALGNLIGHASVPVKMSFSPDGSQLLSADNDGQLILWDITTLAPISKAHEFSGEVRGLVTRLDGNISAWMQNTIWTFNPLNANMIQTTFIPAESILSVSPSGDLVAGYTPLQVSLYDGITGRLKQTLPEEAEDYQRLASWQSDLLSQFYGALFSPSGQHLITFGTGGTWIYSSIDGKLITHLDGNITRKAAISPDDAWLVASISEENSSPVLVNMESAEVIFDFDFPSENNRFGYGNDYLQYAFSPDNHWIGLLRRGWEEPARLELVDTSTGLLSEHLEIKNDILVRLAFSPSATLIAIGKANGDIVIVDMATLKIVVSIDAHTGPITSLTFSKDGRTLISAGEDGLVKIWGIVESH